MLSDKTGLLRRWTGGGVRAEAENQVGMAEGGSPDGRAGPGPAGNVRGERVVGSGVAS